jgi:hypothetical protein
MKFKTYSQKSRRKANKFAGLIACIKKTLYAQVFIFSSCILFCVSVCMEGFFPSFWSSKAYD